MWGRRTLCALALALVWGIGGAEAQAANNPGTGDSGFFTFVGGAASAKVNVASGNLLVVRRDLAGGEASYHVVVDRAYNSLAGTGFSILGPRWTFDVGPSTRVVPQASGEVVLAGPSGYELRFSPGANGAMQAPSGFDGTLRATASGWTLHRDSAGDDWYFDTSGQLTRTRDAAGREFTVQSTSAAGLTVLSSYGTASGRRANFSYTGDSRVREFDDPASGHHYYLYDSGRLADVQGAEGAHERYRYDASGGLSRIELPDGSVIDLVNDSSGRVTSHTVTAAAGLFAGVPRTTRLLYLDHRTRVTDPDGRTTTYVYDDDWRVISTQTEAAVWATLAPGHEALFGDVTGDGAADLVILDPAGAVLVRASTRTGFGTASQWGSFTARDSVTLADVDADGDDDLVGRQGSSGPVVVALSSGTGFAAAATWLSGTSERVLLGDVDGDREADLGLRGTSGGLQVAYAFNSAFRDLGPWASSEPLAEVRLAPVDNDDTADLVEVLPSGTVRVSRSDGVQASGAASWGSVPSGAAVRLADMDGDDQADLVYRTADDAVWVRPSTGSAFGPARAAGRWPAARSLVLADVDGDHRADILGREQNAIWVSLNQGPYSDVAPGVHVPEPGEQEEPDAPGFASAPSATLAAPPMALSWSDEAQLVNPYDATRTAPNPPPQCFPQVPQPCSPQVAYQRIVQAGATWVRLFVLWGKYENDANYRAALRTTVTEARSRGLTVHMTLTSASYDNPARHISPSVTGFGDFVARVVGDFKGLGVERYSLWNEPNLDVFLVVNCPNGAKHNTARKYRELYLEGYRRAIQALPTARIYIGELSELSRSGRDSCESPRGNRSLSTREYLSKVVEGGGIKAHGVAWHAYQHRSAPGTNSKGVGIYDTPLMKKRISDLYKKVGDERPMTTPRGYLPSLLITEFGYFNMPFPKPGDLDVAKTEAERALYYPAALQIALSNGVSVFNFWELGEASGDPVSARTPPDPKTGNLKFDTGMLSIDPADLFNARGTRSYGIGPDPGFANPHPRQTYCAIQDWALGKGYVVDRAPCTP